MLKENLEEVEEKKELPIEITIAQGIIRKEKMEEVQKSIQEKKQAEVEKVIDEMK